MFDFKEIYEPKSVEEVINALVDNPDALIISGGTDIAIKLRDGLYVGRDFVSINGLKELEGISFDEEKNIHIKPNTTFRQITDSEIINEEIGYFSDAVKTIAGPQIRNIATIGGNISNGFTTADSPPMLFSLNASVEVSGQKGKRVMPIAEYYLGPEKMNLKTGELLTDIILPYEDYKGYSCNYIKYAIRESMDIVLIGCAIAVKVSEDKESIDDIKISFSAAGPVPLRAYNCEKVIKGKKISEKLFDDVSKVILNDVSLRSDKRASKEFRLHLCKVLMRRSLIKALKDQGVCQI